MTHRMITEAPDFFVNPLFQVDEYVKFFFMLHICGYLTASLCLKDSPGIFDAVEFINGKYFTILGHSRNTETLGCVLSVHVKWFLL